MEEPELPDIRVVSVIWDDDGLRVETSDAVSKYEALGMLRTAVHVQETAVYEEEIEYEEEDGE